jgi:NAD(P)-dependent dehydrogenase (short-subunit alcohol dehydrogenase family)
MPLDVSSMASVTAFVTAFRSNHQRLDVLINNAGVMLKVMMMMMMMMMHAPTASFLPCDITFP